MQESFPTAEILKTAPPGIALARMRRKAYVQPPEYAFTQIRWQGGRSLTCWDIPAGGLRIAAKLDLPTSSIAS